MSERKVLNKYYPPDYDPANIPRKSNKDLGPIKWVQRVMVPFNCRCEKCGVYIYKGKKFNMRRERVWGEQYLGLAIWRFYFRCPQCLAEISFKTDLENCDYAAEYGAKRLFEAARFIHQQAKDAEAQEELEKQDSMKMLEKRTKQSRFEMDSLQQLQELKEISQKHSKIELGEMLQPIRQQEKTDYDKQEAEDENFVQSIFGKNADFLVKQIEASDSSSDDDDNDDLEYFRQKLKDMDPSLASNSNSETSAGSSLKRSADEPNNLPSTSKEKKAKLNQKELIKSMIKKKPVVTHETTIIHSLVGDYSDSSDSN